MLQWIIAIQCRDSSGGILISIVIWRPPEAASYWPWQPRTSTNGTSVWKSMYRFDFSQRQRRTLVIHWIFHFLFVCFLCVNDPQPKFVTLKASFLNSLRIPKSGNGQVSHFLEFTQQLAHQEFKTSLTYTRILNLKRLIMILPRPHPCHLLIFKSLT